MAPTTGGWCPRHAADVAAASAEHLRQRLEGDLAALRGRPLHNELTVILMTTLWSYTEFGPRGTGPGGPGGGT